jgi:hypothetical protein
MASQRFLLLFLIACGGGGNSGDLPDAVAVDGDPNIDMPGQPGACAYTEAADATNNTSPTAETTGISVTGATAICGKLHNGHFNAGTGAVDIDTFKVSVPANSELLVHLTGGSFAGVQRVAVQVLNATGSQLINNGIVEGDHGTASVRLATGDYVFAAVAANNADIAAPIDYKISIVPDQPATRCAKVTAAANFTEANDGAANNGNDVVSFDQGADPPTSLTPNAADNPEPSAVTAAAGTKYRISGSAANVAALDSYKDKDTYLFTTGATTNQLSVRLNWAATNVDLDFKIYPATVLLSVTGGLLIGNTEDEFQTFAVKPNSQYWLWVGSDAMSPTTAASAYDATICAETFTP